MKNISALAEMLYVVSNFEKSRVKSSGFWNRKYVKSLEESLEVMTLLTNMIANSEDISKDKISFLQNFIYKNTGIIFSNVLDNNILFEEENDFIFLLNNSQNVIKLMDGIIFEIKSLLCAKSKKYKLKISYLLRAFHNLPKVFILRQSDKLFSFDIQPIDCQEAIQYANSYLSLKEKVL